MSTSKSRTTKSESAATESKLPRDVKPMRFDPDLASALEALLEPFTGKALDAAQAAIVEVRNASPTGTFEEVLSAYSSAVNAATAA